MLLTRASEYALLSLALIGQSSDAKDAETLANTLGISKSFLAKILQNLAKADILISYKGAKGGFALKKGLDKISVRDVVCAAEGKAPSVFECSPAQACCPSEKGNTCVIWPFLNHLQERIDTFLDGLSVQDILEP